MTKKERREYNENYRHLHYKSKIKFCVICGSLSKYKECQNCRKESRAVEKNLRKFNKQIRTKERSKPYGFLEYYNVAW